MDARRQVGVVAGLAVVVSVLWLAFVPWDLSEVDARGDLIEGGGDDVFAGWRSVALGVGWFVAVAGSVVAGLRGRWALLTVLVVGSFWFLWRTGDARVIGANLFLAGWVLAFLPAVSVGGFLAVVAGRALRPAVEPQAVAKGLGSPGGRP